MSSGATETKPKPQTPQKSLAPSKVETEEVRARKALVASLDKHAKQATASVEKCTRDISEVILIEKTLIAKAWDASGLLKHLTDEPGKQRATIAVLHAELADAHTFKASVSLTDATDIPNAQIESISNLLENANNTLTLSFDKYKKEVLGEVAKHK